jgi:hypothetical protein
LLEENEVDGIEIHGGRPQHLLWAILFLTLYDTESVHARIAQVDEDTFRKWSWLYIKKLSYLEDLVVSTVVCADLLPAFYFYLTHSSPSLSRFAGMIDSRMMLVMTA